MKTKLKWHNTMEAIPNQDRDFLCVVHSDPLPFKYALLAFDVASRQWRCAPESFNIDYVIAWARLPYPEDIGDDEDEQ